VRVYTLNTHSYTYGQVRVYTLIHTLIYLCTDPEEMAELSTTKVVVGRLLEKAGVKVSTITWTCRV
jgi:hypothetical protein